MSNIGKPAYQGRPDPQKIADRFMLVVIIILVLGFLQAAVKNGWFTSTINFILS
jgi:hypothetical protein